MILIDYKKLTSTAWFDYEVQKMCSIAASTATMYFNKKFVENYLDYLSTLYPDLTNESDKANYRNIVSAYERADNKGAMFDARCFNIPKEEVCNLIYWRQLDAARNSIKWLDRLISLIKNFRINPAITFRIC